MPFGQWEKIVVADNVCFPITSERVVAVYTVGRKVGRCVVGAACILVIFSMATHTIVPIPAKPQVCFGGMTIHTSQIIVCANQWKTVFFVYLGNVVDQPILGGVTPDTIVSDRHTVDITVTCNTLSWSFIKEQGGMTGFAVHRKVYSLQYKICGVVVEFEGVNIDFPSRRSMTGRTVYLKRITVR